MRWQAKVTPELRVCAGSPHVLDNTCWIYRATWLPRDFQDPSGLLQRYLQMRWEQHSIDVRMKAQVLLSCPDLLLGWGAWLDGCVSSVWSFVQTQEEGTAVFLCSNMISRVSVPPTQPSLGNGT